MQENCQLKENDIPAMLIIGKLNKKIIVAQSSLKERWLKILANIQGSSLIHQLDFPLAHFYMIKMRI